MRIVLVGQPAPLYRVVENRDLPSDKDLRFSFFRYCNLSGLDLSQYNLENTDIIDCLANGVNLPLGKTDYLQSRRTDWTGAQIPNDLSSYNHDLLTEAIRQRTGSLSGFQRTLALAIVGRIGGKYLHSFHDGTQFLLDTLQVSRPDLLASAAAIFAPWPRVLQRLQDVFARDDIGPTLPQTATNLTALRIYPLDLTVDVTSVPIGLDRWQAARDLETYIEGQIGEAVSVWLAQSDPNHTVFCVRGRPTGDWWRAAWPG